jgi:hypothetical protein
VVRGPQVVYLSSEKEYYKIHLSKSASSRGFLVKSYLYFETKSGNEIVMDRMEIPSHFSFSGKDTIEIYQGLQKSDFSDNIPSTIFLRFNALTYTKQKIMNKFNISSSDIKLLKVFAFSYDWNLYEYMSSYGGYQDEYSVRLDKPNFSNVVLGNGIFGAIRVDSLELKQ